MPYDFLIGNKSNLSPDPSKKPVNYQESLRTKLTMDPKAMFIASPPTAGIGKKEPRYPPINPVYFPSVTIGDQVWMAENLDISITYNGINLDFIYDYSGGTIDALAMQPIENAVFGNDDSSGLAYSYREFDFQDLGYSGKWYTYPVVQNLINHPPSGWRIPTEEDFDQLIAYLGGNSVAAGYLKGPDTANKWNQTGYTYINYNNPFNSIPSGFASLNEAAYNFLFYTTGPEQITGDFSGTLRNLQLGDFRATKYSSFWCKARSTQQFNDYFPLYYMQWNNNNFVKTDTRSYFNISGANSAGLAMMPIRLIRTY